MVVDAAKIAAHAPLLAALASVPLSERIILLAEALRSRGEDAFAALAQYIALATSASATAQTYRMTLASNEGHFAVVGLQHPSPGTASIICTDLRANGRNHVHSDAIMDSWCADETSEHERGFPWPIVLGGESQLSVSCTGTSLRSNASAPAGIAARGYHVDPLTAALLRFEGELFVEGYNKAFSAATLMSEDLGRRFDRAKQVTHIVAKETLTGDAVRGPLQLAIQGRKLNPRDGSDAAVLPPLFWRLPGARVSHHVRSGDSIQVLPRYTSAGGAGTATFQLTTLGRERYL